MRSIFRRTMPVAAVLSLLLFGVVRSQEPEPEPEPEPVDVTQPRLVVQSGHTSAIQSVAFSSDGRRILSGAEDAVRLWDALTGKELLTLPVSAHALAFSSDGRQILTCTKPPPSGVQNVGKTGTAQLWDTLTGKELLTIKNPGHIIRAVAISPDGKRLATGGGAQVKLWDAQSGKLLRALDNKKPRETTESVAFSPDGKRILAGYAFGHPKLWDVDSGRELIAFKKAGRIHSAAFSPDGKHILTGTPTRVMLWEVNTGNLVRELKDIEGPVAFAPDGRRFLTGAPDQTARLWEASTGRLLVVFKGHAQTVNAVAFSPDGERVLTGSKDETVRLWDARTGKQQLVLKGPPRAHQIVAISRDGTRILNCSRIAGARLWDARKGTELFALEGHTGRVTSGCFAPDGKQILTGSEDKTARLWDAETGKERLVLMGRTGAVTSVAFSPDGKRCLTGTAEKTARLWDAETGKELCVLVGHTGAVTSVAFSHDGKRLLTAGDDETARVWDAETGKETLVVHHKPNVTSAVFSPDGKRILLGTGGWVRVWDIQAGKWHLPAPAAMGYTNRIRGTSVAYSPDGKQFLTGGRIRNANLWNANNHKVVFELKGHTAHVSSVTFSADGKFILTGSQDNLARLWNARTGAEMCRLISFADGGWAVVDPQGRYDASRGGDVDGLHWVVDQEAVALDQLKERYYDPGLLAKILGFNKEPLREVGAVQNVKLYPQVAVQQADPKKTKLDVTLTNRGGGIGRVIVKINGKERTADARAPDSKADAKQLVLQVDLASDPRLVPGKKNTVEVLAYNGDGSLVSRGLVREVDGPGTEVVETPTVHAVIVGVSKYSGDKLNLRYAAKDAEDFATALRLASGRLFGTDKVQVTLLTGAEAQSRPSRANLVRALEELKGTKPGDLVVVYLAGHGVTQGGQDGDWYYLTADAKSGDLADAAVRRQVALSSAELTDLLKQSPARKQVLILDTCHAAAAIPILTQKRDVPGSQVRALERVKDRTGMHVLAGCAADSVSYEASRYGQGLLTYSLLLGMRGAKLREGEYVDVVDLFSFAADKVPELAREIGGIQRPTVASPKGTSFDVGRLTAEDRAKVPLQTVKPVLTRTSFQDEQRIRDVLDLSKRVNDRFKDESATPRGAKLVFFDTDNFSGALQLVGRYKQKGEMVTVNMTLFQGEKEVAAFTVEGTSTQIDQLAEMITVEIERKVAGSTGK